MATLRSRLKSFVRKESFFATCDRDEHGRCIAGTGGSGSAHEGPKNNLPKPESESSVPPPVETVPQSEVQQSYIDDAAKMAENEYTQHIIVKFKEKVAENDERWSKIHNDVIKIVSQMVKLEKAYYKEVAAMENMLDADAASMKAGNGSLYLSGEVGAQGEKVDLALGKFLKHRRERDQKAWGVIKKALNNKDRQFENEYAVKEVKLAMDDSMINREQVKAVKEVESMLSGMISSRLKMRLDETVVKRIPADQKQRSHFKGTRHQGTDQGIYLGGMAGAATIAHELGHSLETMYSIHKAARAFLYSRVGKEPAKPMGGTYDPWEVGRDDEFAKAFDGSARYVGKHYKTDDTEITSMGLEKMYSDPVDFAQKDPEYFKFILGVLDGSFA